MINDVTVEQIETRARRWRQYMHWTIAQAVSSDGLDMSRSAYIDIEQGRTGLDRRTELAMLRLANAGKRFWRLDDFLSLHGTETGL
jgi:transcriptional regulator with XRE-family HTH domain